MTNKVASCMSTGTHGSTYGSNPLAMAVGNAVLDVILSGGFFAHVAKTGALLKKELEKIVHEFPDIFSEVRGRGLMLGLKVKNISDIKNPNIFLVQKLREQGLLTSPAQDNMIRITPPLIIGQEHILEAMAIMRKTFSNMKWN